MALTSSRRRSTPNTSPFSELSSSEQTENWHETRLSRLVTGQQEVCTLPASVQLLLRARSPLLNSICLFLALQKKTIPFDRSVSMTLLLASNSSSTQWCSSFEIHTNIFPEYPHCLKVCRISHSCLLISRLNFLQSLWLILWNFVLTWDSNLTKAALQP